MALPCQHGTRYVPFPPFLYKALLINLIHTIVFHSRPILYPFIMFGMMHAIHI